MGAAPLREEGIDGRRGLNHHWGLPNRLFATPSGDVSVSLSTNRRAKKPRFLGSFPRPISSSFLKRLFGLRRVTIALLNFTN